MEDGEEKIECTYKLTMRLIGEMKQRPCLWNKDDSAYLNYAFKAAAYEDISQIIDVPSEVIRVTHNIFSSIQKNTDNPSYATLPTSPSSETTATSKRERSADCNEITTTTVPLEKYELNNKQGEQLGDFSEANKKFGAYVVRNLINIQDYKFVKRTKARIKLILSEAMTERAKTQLSECLRNGDF